jgi:hypothetical protein
MNGRLQPTKRVVQSKAKQLPSRSKHPLLLALLLVTTAIVMMRAARHRLEQESPPFTPLGCSNDVLQTLPNPKQASVATLIERDCGATTNFVRLVYVLPASSRILDAPDEPVTVANGQGILSIAWKDERTLQITYKPQQTEFFQQKTVLGKFTILYTQQPTAALTEKKT